MTTIDSKWAEDIAYYDNLPPLPTADELVQPFVDALVGLHSLLTAEDERPYLLTRLAYFVDRERYMPDIEAYLAVSREVSERVAVIAGRCTLHSERVRHLMTGVIDEITRRHNIICDVWENRDVVQTS